MTIFLPTRALCPSCLIMKAVLQDQDAAGTISFALDNHMNGIEPCIGSGAKVVRIDEMNWQDYFARAA